MTDRSRGRVMEELLCVLRDVLRKMWGLTMNSYLLDPGLTSQSILFLPQWFDSFHASRQTTLFIVFSRLTNHHFGRVMKNKLWSVNTIWPKSVAAASRWVPAEVCNASKHPKQLGIGRGGGTVIHDLSPLVLPHRPFHLLLADETYFFYKQCFIDISLALLVVLLHLSWCQWIRLPWTITPKI